MSGPRHRVTALLAAVLAGTLTAGLVASPGAGAGGVTVTQTVTNQWNSGYEAAMAIVNNTAAPLRGWRLEFDLPHRISSIWDAVLVTQVGDHVVIEGPTWQRDIPRGGTVRLGYVAGLTGARREPTNCRINGITCSFGGAVPTSSSSSSTTSSSTSSTTTPPSSGGVTLA